MALKGDRPLLLHTYTRCSHLREYRKWRRWFFGTLLVGLGVWAGLALLLFVFNLSEGFTRVFSEVNRMQRVSPPRYPFNNFTEPDIDGRVVEGSVSDLEEERKKRRQEQ